MVVYALHYVDFSFKVQASIPRWVCQNGATSLRLQVVLTAVTHRALRPQTAPGRPVLHSPCSSHSLTVEPGSWSAWWEVQTANLRLSKWVQLLHSLAFIFKLSIFP